MDTFTLLKDLTRFAMAAAMRWFPVAPVTSAHHSPRALKLARQYNLDVSAFPTDWRLPARVLPMTRSSIGLREHVALLLDRRGEI